MDSSKASLRWLGHAGFRLEVPHEGQSKVIYIDAWMGNPKLPTGFEMPSDADLILVSHGHFDHASSAPDILKAATNKDAKIGAIFELGKYYAQK
mmetsp:Transcript_34198/g.24707  ORF Transcript_34198/g.24707 Transcript_34198/m.24707 type:complete len:94 (+) Transcript_34198:28-309(+)